MMPTALRSKGREGGQSKKEHVEGDRVWQSEMPSNMNKTSVIKLGIIQIKDLIE